MARRCTGWTTAVFGLAMAAAPEPAAGQPIAAGGGFAARGIAQCRTDLGRLNPLTGWQVRWPQDWAELATASDDQIREAVRRWTAVPEVLRADLAALQDKKTARAPAAVLRRVRVQIDQLSADLARSAPPLPRTASPDLRRSWEKLFGMTIRPAIERYRAFLNRDYRPSGDFGLARVPGGRECFRRAVALFSTADLAVEEIEAVGWRRLRAGEDELLLLHGLQRRDLPVLLARLRRHREAGFTADRLVALSESAIRRAIAAVPRLFIRQQVAPVVVRPVPRQMEASFPAAAYHGSHAPDEAAVFALNLSRPEERRLTAEAIAFHETIPGHHATEGLGYPLGGPSSAFLEGWGMYAEQLAGEIGLYGSPADRAGMLVRRLTAATRPIVETGLHAKGWSRMRALRFMRKHTALGDTDIALEVDRLLAGPGQPSSYIIGYDRFISLRSHARAKLGDRFDLRAFHDEILRKGARPLSELQSDVKRWVEKQSVQ